jgi:chaperonin cofactor prefoldin
LGTDADEDSIFDEVAKTIEDIYTEAKNKKEVLSDDNDLNGFYSTYIKAKFGTGVSNKFRNLLDFILNRDTAPEMSSIDELLEDNEVYATADSNFFSMTSDQSQLDFIEQVEIFTKALGRDNIAAVRAYREAERILRSASTAPDELVALIMNEMFGTINGQSIVDFVQKIDNLRKDIKYHPFEDLFAEFIISVNGTPSKLLDILRSEEKRLALQENLLDYTMDNDFVKEELREIGLLLNAFRGIIHGAFDGTNSRINPYRQNIEGKELLADLDETAAKILLEDAERLQMRIDTLLRINEASQSRKSKMQQKIACNMRPKFIKGLLNPAFIKLVEEKFDIDLKGI